MTGVPFNSVPLPASARATIRKAGLVQDSAGVNAAVEDEFDLDMDVAGEVISGISRGLSVSTNEIKANLDSDALLGKIDWKIVILNSSKYDREARAKILIPHNSVVTRATLVVDGVERDATIMVRGQARKVYVQSAQSKVKRRDPLLVSTCGPDEILLQCFPIKPNNFAEIKLEIACPMELDATDDAALALPTIVEKNFLQDQPAKLELNAKHPARISGIVTAKSRQSDDGRTKQSADISEEKEHLSELVSVNSLNNLGAVIHARRDHNVHTVFCHDRFASPIGVVQQTISHVQRQEPLGLSVIIDASGVMQPYVDEIIDGLKTIPANVPVQLTVVGDSTKSLLSQPTLSSDPSFAAALSTLKKLEFVAGQDDSKALLEAAKDNASHNLRAVLWIHAAQPIHDAKKEDLRSILKNNKNHLVLYDFIVCAGPQEMLEGAIAGDSLVMVPRY
ncbi:MAG: hypothetical protein HYX67_17025, partial [Candidatus Melainabacteria bacterium]|nr:hypothetical protein [Candidatus Melainabacteria bacterium]